MPEPLAETSQVNKKLIAKNTLMLYVRMFLTMVVGLYTSRVVLNTLGVEDYGIYGVVGGVVGMLGFLNASMSGATSRFLTFELGRGNRDRLAKTFSSALIVHFIIALIVLVLSETVGLWFLNNKLVIPEGRMTAARWVYQLSILSAMLGVTQVPYNSSIIAHEKMDVYAYVEILNVTLKLLIVFLLVLGNFDKLILYSILTLAVSIIVRMTYRIYCIQKFDECHFHWIWDKEFLKPLLSFSGWEVFGHFGFTFRQQGINFALNMVFGAIANAGASIASTIQGVLQSFSQNIIVSFRPQIIKRYAVGEYESMKSLLISSTKISVFVASVTCFPVLMNNEYLIRLWLGSIPQYSIGFTNYILLSCIVSSFSQNSYGGLQACGNIKLSSIFRTVIYLLTPIVVWCGFKYCSLSPNFSFFCVLASQVFITVCDIVLLKIYLPFISIFEYIKIIVLSSGALSISYFICKPILELEFPDFCTFIISFVSNIIIIGIVFFCMVFAKEDRRIIKQFLIKLFRYGNKRTLS